MGKSTSAFSPLGYRAIILIDAVCIGTDETHDASLKLLESRFTAQMEAMLTEAFLPSVARWRPAESLSEFRDKTKGSQIFLTILADRLHLRKIVLKVCPLHGLCDRV